MDLDNTGNDVECACCDSNREDIVVRAAGDIIYIPINKLKRTESEEELLEVISSFKPYPGEPYGDMNIIFSDAKMGIHTDLLSTWLIENRPGFYEKYKLLLGG